jgi:uncharacterized protein YrrD
MLKNTKSLYGTKIMATDGHLGHITDFYFDDEIWVVRYVVVDTGTWLAERLVLLSPYAFGRLDTKAGILNSQLTKAQIEASPAIDTHRPISRQFEIDYHRHYGWPCYWDGGAMWGMSAYPEMIPPLTPETAHRVQHVQRDDNHLRSSHKVSGYAVQSIDGQIGEVTGFLLNDRSWVIRSLVVDTGEWFAKKEVLVGTEEVERIGYDESKVFVKLSKEDIQATVESEMAKVGNYGAAGFQD